MKRAASAAVLAAALAWSLPANAASVAIAGDARDPFVVRLLQELAALGIDVVAVGSTNVLRVTSTSIDLFEIGADGEPGRRLFSDGRRDALRIAEHVHATLLPPVARPEPPAPPPPSPPSPPSPPKREMADADRGPAVVPSVTSSSPRRARLHAGGGAFFGGREPGATLEIGLSYRAFESGRLSVGGGLSFTGAVVPEKVRGIEGTAHLRAFLAGPEVFASYALAPSTRVDAGVGALLLFLDVEGRGVGAFPSRSTGAWGVTPNAHLRLSQELGSVGVYLDARIGVVAPPIAIRFAENTVHEWGKPWASIGAGAYVPF